LNILLIDDHALFRIGLRELLERRGITVLEALGDCEAGIEKVINSQPDVVVLDIRMPQMTGIEVLKALREREQKMPIAMLTTSRDEKDVIDALQGGAQGYLLKDMEPDDLIRALNDIVNGQTVVAPELTMVLAKAVKGDIQETQSEDNVFAELTPREGEILCLLAEGQSNKIIAHNLGISDGTVKLHVKSILRKLSVRSRVEAAVIAVEKRLCMKEN